LYQNEHRQRVELPKVRSLDLMALGYCPSVVDLVLSANLVDVGAGCFGHMTSLCVIDVPSGLAYIPDVCFYACDSLVFLELPDSVVTPGRDRRQWLLQASTDELWLTVVTIQPGADLVAKGLVVQNFLQLEVGAKLFAAPLDQIDLGADIEIRFSSPSATKLPSLDLGDIGDAYAVVPALRNVEISSGDIPSDLHQPIVQGKTLSNCESWKAKVKGLPDGAEAQCETIAASAKSLLGGGEVIGLFVVKSKSDDGGIPVEVIVGVAVAVAVAVLVVTAPASWCARNERTMNQVRRRPDPRVNVGLPFAFSWFMHVVLWVLERRRTWSGIPLSIDGGDA
jgi:hypothetical protein